MPRKPVAYHHGDLRRALLAEAALLVEAEGVDALTLRALGRRIGVSHAAPAHHFTDKAGLLAELAADGFEELSAALEEAAHRGRTGAARLREVGRAYLRFARTRPGHYRVMFGRGLGQAAGSERLAAAGGRAFEALRGAVAAALPPAKARSAERVRDAAFLAWSSTHGAAMLILDGSLAGTVTVAAAPDEVDALVLALTESIAGAVAG
jgi:AcrR family transcriptional regulator